MDEHIYYFILSIILIVLVSIMIIRYEPITDRLEKACNEYDMIYIYWNGNPNYLDKNNTLHPIYTECPVSFYKSDPCKIRFISGYD